MRDTLHNAPLDRLTGQFALRPLADRHIQPLGVLASQRHDLTHLLRGECSGAPQRGASLRRSATSAEFAAASQRRRQWRTVLRQTPSISAVSPMPLPVAASRMMRARSASFCGVECARTSALRAASCSAESWIAGALCAGIAVPLFPPGVSHPESKSDSRYLPQPRRLPPPVAAGTHPQLDQSRQLRRGVLAGSRPPGHLRPYRAGRAEFRR